jgi:hypothetical protein
MLREIDLGFVTADLIAVDTAERLGRTEEIDELRRKLFTDYGILVVTADSNFADPTGVTGKALRLVENIRSTEDGRVKAHNVIRGKKDTAKLKWWPGGPPPLGFRLKHVEDRSVAAPRMHSVLEPIPAYIAAVRLAFARVDATGHGPSRLARWWNGCPDIPDELKPISAYTLGYVLRNRIYIGTLVWGANCTGVINDTRVIEKNPDGPLVTVADFCPAVIDRDLFDRVQHLQSVRSESYRALRVGSDEPDKLIAPQGARADAEVPAHRAGAVRAVPGVDAGGPVPAQDEDGREEVRVRALRLPAGRGRRVRERPVRARGAPARRGHRPAAGAAIPAAVRTGPGARLVPRPRRPRPPGTRAPPRRRTGPRRDPGGRTARTGRAAGGMGDDPRRPEAAGYGPGRHHDSLRAGEGPTGGTGSPGRG